MKNVPKKLLVIIPDRLSELSAKGELIDRYYNPGDYFREIHILMTNDDHPDKKLIQKTTGSAKLVLHNLPSPSFKNTLGWQYPLIKDWVKQGIALAQLIKPVLIRTHNNFLEGYLAYEIRKNLGIPYIVSLHGVWDRDVVQGSPLKDRLIRLFRTKLEKKALQNAEHVIAVYEPIIRYAKKMGAKNVDLIYNIVAQKNLSRKTSYKLSKPPRLITVNRQVKEKNPENIIKAIKKIDCKYLIVGNGDFHEHLQEVTKTCACESKVEFVIAIPNEKLCKMYKEFDIMVSHCDYWGTPKSIIEAAMVGLPIIINRHPLTRISEYRGDWVLLCDNTPEDYLEKIEMLLENDDLRKRLGERAYDFAHKNFDPEKMEKKMMQIYQNIIDETRTTIQTK